MAKKKQKKRTGSFWFGVGLISALAIAPNATLLKVLLETLDPILLNALRSIILVLVALPFLLFYHRKYNRHNVRYALLAGVCMTIAVTSMLYALKASQASYVVVLGLLSPIFLIMVSRRVFGEKIKPRAAAGITLAFIGALIAVGLPLLLSGNSTTAFYPLATILMVVNCVAFTLGLVLTRKAHETGLPLTATSGITSAVIAAVAVSLALFTHVDFSQVPELAVSQWAILLYSAVIVVFVARMLSVAAYERIGSVPTGAFSYLSTVVALLIPIIVLGEQLPLTMVVGAMVILVGVYLTERHHFKHHPHVHLFKHH